MKTNCNFPLNAPIPITLPRCMEHEVEAILVLLDEGAPVIHIRKPEATVAELDQLLMQLQTSGTDMRRLTLHHHLELAQRFALGGIHLREVALQSLQKPLTGRQESDDLLPQLDLSSVASDSNPSSVELSRTMYSQSSGCTQDAGPERPSTTFQDSFCFSTVHSDSQLQTSQSTPDESMIATSSRFLQTEFRVSAPAHSWEEACRLAAQCDYVLFSPLFDSVSKSGYRGAIDPAEVCQLLRRYHDGNMIALGGITLQNISLARAAAFDGVAAIGSIWKLDSTGAIDVSRTRLAYQRLTRRWQAAGGTLQFISDGTLATVEAYLKGGGRWVQLRMKETPAETIITRGKTLLPLCHQYGALLIVNDDPQLAAAIGADGVHLGQSDMAPDDARKLLGERAIIGCTANTFEQIQKIAQSSADYIGLGPFRYTTTKKNLAPLLGVEGYTRIMQQMAEAGIRLPLVAIGGITLEDVPQIMACGVNGLAISGSISHAADVTFTTAQFVAKIAQHRTVIMPKS